MANGKFAWFEIVSTDLDASLRFYSETIGWSLAKKMGQYQMLSVGEQPVAGAVTHGTNGGGLPGSHWLSYISTDDVDATVAKALELGGVVVKPAHDVPGVGRMAVMLDPQGALFAPYKAENESPASEPTEGSFVWSELMVDDPAAGLEFYRALFGWGDAGSSEMGELGTYHMFGTAADQPCGGAFKAPEGVPAGWVYYTHTEDLDAAISRIERNGGRLTNGPNPVDGGRIAGFVDPQGAAFALHERT